MNMIDFIWIAITTLCLSQQISQCHTYSNVPATTPALTSVRQVPFNKIGPSIQRSSIHKTPSNQGAAPPQQFNTLTTSVPTIKGPTGSSAGTAVVFSFIKFYKSNTNNKKVLSNTEFTDGRLKGNISNTGTITTKQAALLAGITPDSTSVMAYTTENRELPVMQVITGTTPPHTMIGGTRYLKTQWTPITDATTGRTPATAKDGTKDNKTSQIIGSATENKTPAVIVDTISKTPVTSTDGNTGNMTASVIYNRTPPMIDGTMNNRTSPMVDDTMNNRTPPMTDDTMTNRTPPMIDDTMNNRTPPMTDDTMTNRTPPMINGTINNRTPPVIDDTMNNRTPPMTDATMTNRTPPMIDGTINNRTPPVIDDTMNNRTPPMIDDTMNNRTTPVIDGTMNSRTPFMMTDTMTNGTPSMIDNTIKIKSPPKIGGTTNNKTTLMTNSKTDQKKSEINGIKDKNKSSGRATQVLSVDHEVRSPTTPPSPVGLVAESSMKYIIPTAGVALTVSVIGAILFVYIRRRNHAYADLIVADGKHSSLPRPGPRGSIYRIPDQLPVRYDSPFASPNAPVTRALFQGDRGNGRANKKPFLPPFGRCATRKGSESHTVTTPNRAYRSQECQASAILVPVIPKWLAVRGVSVPVSGAEAATEANSEGVDTAESGGQPC